MAVRPTGRLLGERMPSLARPLDDDVAQLVVAFDRHFDATADTVWSALTDPERTALWSGPWRPVAGSGRDIEITMTAEQDAPRVPVHIMECVPNQALTLRLGEGPQAWVVSFYLDSDRHARQPSTTLTLVQTFTAAETLEQAGPGWEYYLDRLVAAETGGDPEAIGFVPEYLPGLVGHYRDVIRTAIAAGAAGPLACDGPEDLPQR